MRVKTIQIDGLFGMFNHVIPLNTDQRITILHGPNGVGKTTVLRLITDLFSKRFYAVRTINYRSLRVEFLPPDPPLTIFSEAEQESGPSRKVRIVSKIKGRKVEYELATSKEFKQLARIVPRAAIDEFVPSLERVSPDLWLDESTGEVLDLDQVWFRYGDSLPFEVPRGHQPFPDWLSELLGSLPTHFIQTQRLFAVLPTEVREYRRKKPRHLSTVEKYSADMADKIQQTLRQSGVLAASLDRTFPHRLLESQPPKTATEKRIRSDYEEQAEYRNRLMKAWLIEAEDPVALPESDMDSNERKLLWHYLRDVEKKFDVFDNILQRIELFISIINSRFQYKTFSVDKADGFVFSTRSGERIPLPALSSGEQHELVLAYELLFIVQKNAMILIDEPELSLHVTWQHKFLDDIERISELANLDFVVATHSPSIIHDRSDLMVQLGEQ